MKDFIAFYKMGMAFSFVCGCLFAFAHEVTKYLVKRYILKIPYK